MNLEWTELGISGCFVTKLASFTDARGSFQKLFNSRAFDSVLSGFVPRECYLTTSAHGVLRGMHFQLPPNDHAKVVICLGGRALDVVVDLRPGPDYGRTAEVVLTPKGINCVAMPIGVGHGFYADASDTQLLYLVGTGHSAVSDFGVHWNSIGIEWPCTSPILSERDKAHPPIDQFSPPEKWRRS